MPLELRRRGPTVLRNVLKPRPKATLPDLAPLRAGPAEHVLQWIPPGRSRGRPQHFYHLIVDVAVPLSSILDELSTPEPLPLPVLVTSVRPRFDRFLTTMFGDAIRVVPASTTSLDPVLVHGHDPLHVRPSRDAILGLRERVLERIAPPPPEDSMVVIRRGPPEPELLAGGRSSGDARRHIANHDELVDALRSAWPHAVHDVVLEQMSLEAQVRAFSGARLIVGQHGAGLVNLIWSRRAAVLELGLRGHPHFARLSRLAGLDHSWIPMDAKVSSVDTAHVVERALTILGKAA